MKQIFEILKNKKNIVYFIFFDLILFVIIFWYFYFTASFTNKDLLEEKKELYVENIQIISDYKESFTWKNIDENDKIKTNTSTVFEELLKEDLQNNKNILEEKKEIIKEEKKDIVFDFESDNSIQKYVSDKIHYNNLSYIPQDLVALKWEFIIDTKWNQILRKEAIQNLDKLSKDFYNDFKVKLKIVSAYRSYTYQKWIKDRWCSDLFCAKAWYSEHQSGLAIDIFEATTKQDFLSKSNLKKYFNWMEINAYKYGFHNSYKNGREVDGYTPEPWHWRYVWEVLATILHKQNITFAEYIKKL